MPILLKPLAPDGKFTGCSSVLFVACPVCPRMCLAVEKNEPYLSISQLFRKGDYFDEFIAERRKALEREGTVTATFKVPLPSGMMCLWPEKLRRRLAEQVSSFDAVAVIGCQSAVRTVAEVTDQEKIRIITLMEEEGIANFKTKIRFPFTMELSA